MYKLCIKEFSLCHKLKFSNPYIFAKYWPKPLVFQTLIINSLKYLTFTTLGQKDIGI